jgi:hypothetical protein
VAGLTLLAGYGYERYRIDDWQQSATQEWVEPVGSEFLLRDTSRSHQWGNRLFNLGTYLAPGYDGHFGSAPTRPGSPLHGSQPANSAVKST